MRQFFVDLPGLRTFVRTAGDGEPLIFLHGAQLNADLWTGQLVHFAPAFSCVACDLRGHGRTGSSPAASYSADLYAADLQAFLDTSGLGQVVLCGLSLGGMIAQTFAAQHPERVRALVLCDTGVSTRYFASDRVLNLAMGLMAAPLLGFFGVTRYRQFTHCLHYCIGQKTWVTQTPAGLRLATEAMDMIAPGEVVKILRSVLHFHGNTLSRPDLPVLILNGQQDSPLILRQARILQALYPGSAYEVVPEASHLSNVDNPDFFNRVLERFLLSLHPADQSANAACQSVEESTLGQ